MLSQCRLLSSACLAMLLVSGLAGATAQRTFVSASGVDNPACSIGAPCRTLGAAITATSSDGEVLVVDSAGYGPVTITKSVSIIVPAGVYGGITVTSGNGVTINAPGATVVLRGLSINGQGGANGILVQAAARVRIENCVVSNMAAQGIYDQAANGEVIVLDTISRDNGDGGFAVVAANATIVLDHVRSEHNANVGFYIAPTPAAIYAQATISDLASSPATGSTESGRIPSKAPAHTSLSSGRHSSTISATTSRPLLARRAHSSTSPVEHNVISGIYFSVEGLGILRDKSSARSTAIPRAALSEPSARAAGCPQAATPEGIPELRERCDVALLRRQPAATVRSGVLHPFDRRQPVTCRASTGISSGANDG